MGLAISRRIIEHMGGQLQLESSTPQGSTFAFTIALPDLEQRQNTRPDLPLSHYHVLLISASIFEAPFLGERLAEAGARLTRAKSYDQSLELFASGVTPDIVIIDCALGEEITPRLAQASKAAGVSRSLVLFSPFERRSFDQNRLNGFDGWLVKPVRARSLLAHLAQHFDSQTQGGTQETLTPRSQTLQGRHILLAEDNDINALIATKHLQAHDLTISRARNGQEALNEAMRALNGEIKAFDAILMDIRMPELDGIEVTRRIRRVESEMARGHTPIIALTANAFDEDRDQCLKAGFDEFLTKPIDREDLIACLGKAILEPTLQNRTDLSSNAENPNYLR